MLETFQLFGDFFTDIYNLLNMCVFPVGAVSVRLADLLIAFIVIGFALSVFWKGARA